MDKDITQLVTVITWSGDYQQAARTLAFSIAVSPTDPNLPAVSMSMGNMVKLFDDDGNELFRGYIFARDKSNASNEMTVTAYDGLIYLTKSTGTYNFKDAPAEGIANKVASDFGISVGSVAITGILQNFIADAQTISDIIMQAYTSAGSQNGKKYILQMSKGLLNVVEKGSVIADHLLSDDINISDSAYSESIEGMIDQVKIYDSDKNQTGVVNNSGNITSYGMLQSIYNAQDGVDSTTAATNMLKGIARASTVTVLGSTDCVTGNAVNIQEPYTGVTGKFYILTDQHTWQDGQHTMQLTLDLA
jgi:hypothetical protein